MAAAAARAHERTAVPAGRRVPVGHLRPRAQVRCAAGLSKAARCWWSTDAPTASRLPESLCSACWACLFRMRACAHTRASLPGVKGRCGSRGADLPMVVAWQSHWAACACFLYIPDS